MSFEERIGQLKERLASIQKEAARKEFAKKQALREQEEKKRDELAKESGERKLADENWSRVKPYVLETLQRLSTEALMAKGRITGWERKYTGVHHHSHEARGEYGSTEIHGYTFRASVEIAELQITDIGKLIVFRPIAYERGDVLGKNFSREDEAKKGSVYVGIFIPRKKERPEYNYEILCPECGNVTALSLILPSDEIIAGIEKTLSKKLISLHEVALLEE